MIYKNKRKKGITSMKMNLKNKITFNICVIVTLSLVVMCTSLYAMSASILSEDSNTFTEVQILRAQEKIELQVDKIRLETLALSREQRVRNFFKGELGTDELNRFLTDTMEAMNRESESYYYKDLFCLGMDGVIISSTMPNAMYVDLSRRKYVQDSFKKSTTETSDILIALTDQASIVNTTHPIFDENGEMLGCSALPSGRKNLWDLSRIMRLERADIFPLWIQTALFCPTGSRSRSGNRPSMCFLFSAI